MAIEVKPIRGLRKPYPPHFHEETALALVRSGRSLPVIGGERVEVEAGDLVLMPAGVVHACNPVDLAVWSYILVLAGRDDLLAFFGRDTLPEPLGRARIRRGTGRGIAPDLRTAAGREAFAAELLELLVAPDPAPRRPPGRAPRDPAMDRIADLLRARYAESIPLAGLAARAGESPYGLIRRFRRAFGMTPHAWLTNVRINAAKERLAAGGDIATVALETGFYDQSHFTNVFLRYVGLPPGAWAALRLAR